MTETIDHDHDHDHEHVHDHVSLEEKRLAVELTSITLSKNPDWDPRADWVDQADYAGKLFARILRYVREELAEDGDEEEFEDDDVDEDDEEDDDDEDERAEHPAHGRRR